MVGRTLTGRAVAAAAAVSTLGCSTSYVPRTPGRVAMVMESGSPAYVRDGHVYSGGLFGADLEEAVRGNPEAERHARAYRAGVTGGFVSVLLGTAGMVSGVIVVADGTENHGHHPAEEAVGSTLLIGGLAAYITGFVLLVNAQPHMFDAINVFNDGVPNAPPQPYPGAPVGQLPPPPGPPPPPGLAPPPTSTPIVPLPSQ